MRRLFTILFACVAATGFSYTPSPNQILKETSKAFADVAKKVTPAVVYVKVELNKRKAPQGGADPFDFFNEDFFEYFFGPSPRGKQRPDQVARGTGFLVSPDGYIMSNNHVVQNAEKVTILLHDGREFDAQIIGTDPSTDLAVLKIDVNKAPYLEFGNSDEVEVGEWVVAIGNPFGLDSTVTAGIVSAKGRSDLNISKLENFIQTDASINPGNSGGPMTLLNGKVIGINTAILTRSGGSMGIGFAIPSNTAVHVLEHLKESGAVSRGYLGIQPQELTTDLAEGFNLPKNTKGVVVALVQPGSPAQESGLQAGDVITSINGKTVKSSGALRHQIALLKPDSKVKLVVIRDGKSQNLTVTLGINKDEFSNYPGLKKIGIDQVDHDTPLQTDATPPKGVRIKAVHAGSPIQLAGIRSGSMILAANNQQVESAAELEKIVQESLKTGHLLLLVRQGNVIRFIHVKLD